MKQELIKALGITVDINGTRISEGDTVKYQYMFSMGKFHTEICEVISFAGNSVQVRGETGRTCMVRSNHCEVIDEADEAGVS